MTSRTQKIGFGAFAGVVLLVFYFPLLSVALASLSKKRYFSFPIENYTLKWYSDAIHSAAISEYVTISLKIAALTTIFSLVIGFFAALAYARYPWRGRKSFQRLVLLPLFFPQTVLGLALLMWFSFLGVTTSWMTAVVAHTVWIAPIATLIIAIQAYSLDPSLEEASRDLGATRWQTLRMVTLPLLGQSLFSAGCFSFLLSWGNFALSLFTTGADSALPEWLYSRMVVGYQPLIPAVGTLSVLGAVAVALVLLLFLQWRSRRHKTTAPAA
ncbi:MAG TPA: ABC transporter permease [Opitutaceae bacterium]|nr:ABC transporter permease [Opitutaceae bacterium]HPG17221.1 ABC transporter permease [Opitutaceae bacterium]HPN99756.1 ABC transporter permease [Opitutaceae bacterium]